MDGLFKLIFYIIIGIVWVLSNKKNQALWDEEQSNLPPKQPQAKPLPKPKIDPAFLNSIFPEPMPEREGMFAQAEQPSREGLSSEPEQPAPFDHFKQSYYDKKLEMKKQRLHKQKKTKLKQPVLQTDFNTDDYVEKTAKPSAPAIVANRRQKQSYHLKSSLKEGIIWSIVLGAPRSKQTFNWRTSPLNR
ncbi:MAG: hypothetical protein KJ915_03990 [Candidatus Omnitrophica bacterium]|nr:hypothetical protein [Candidatus Omnitrophota bacterium]